MSFDNTKYDVELNGVGHRINGYKKSEANAFVPRLGTGDQTESEFDLLRSKTIDGFAGGSLQRNFDDNTSCYGIEGHYPFANNGVLYANSSVNTTLFGTLNLKMKVLARVQTKLYAWILFYDVTAAVNKMYRIDQHMGWQGSPVAITVPAKLQPYTTVSIVVHAGQVWISGSDGTHANDSIWYMDFTATTMTEVTGGTGSGFGQMVSYKGSIYGTGAETPGQLNSILYKYTGDTSTRTYAEVGRVTNLLDDNGARLFVFNNRITLSRIDGLWTYDSVLFSAIDDLSLTVDVCNYRHATVHLGYVYFWMKDGFYRYNGALIEKLYDTFELGFPIDMISGGGRLWILFVNSSCDARTVSPWFGGSWPYDQAIGHDYNIANAGKSIEGRLMVFNGTSLYTWGRTPIRTLGSLPDGTLDIPDRLQWFMDSIAVFTNSCTASGFPLNVYGFLSYIQTSGSILLVTSVWDGDFSQVTKDMENIEFVLDDASKVPAFPNAVLIEYRTTNFSSSGGWATFGSVVIGTDALRKWVYDSIPAGLQADQRIQFRFTSTSGFGQAGLAKLILRSSLMPDMKYQWQFTVLAYGDEQALEPLLLADGSESVQTVSSLRENIYAARYSKVPTIFCDVDQVMTTGSHNSVVTTINVDSTNLLRTAGFIKIENEIIKYTGKTSTTLTGCTRGVLGTSAATHTTAGTKAFPTYRVMLRQLVNERIELTDKTIDQVSGQARATELTILVQEV